MAGMEAVYSLCAQSNLQAFSRIISPRRERNVSWIVWGWEEKKEGVTAESNWPGQHYFFSLTEHLLLRNLQAGISVFLYRISHFCILCFPSGWHWRYLEEMAAFPKLSHAIHLQAQPCSKSNLLTGTFPCPRRGLCRGPVSSRSQCSSHTSTHWEEMIFGDGIRPCCLIYGEGAGCIGLSSGWVSSISLGCPHHYGLSALSSNTLIYYCGRNDWNL